MRSCVLLGLLWLSATGCAERSTLVVPALPSGTYYLGLVFQGEGERWAGTGLSRVEAPGFELDVVEPGDDYTRVTLVALRPADVQARTSLGDEALRDSPLLAPSANRAVLSTAFSASALRDGDALRLESDDPPLPVAADWSGRCPAVLGETPAPVEITCSSRSCPTTVRQRGCALEFESSSCPYNTAGTIDGFGQLAVSLGEPVGECRGTRGGDGEIRLGCESDLGPAGKSSCELIVHETARPGPPLELEHRRLGDPGAPPASHRRVRARGLAIEPEQLLTIHQPLGLPDSFDLCEGEPSELLALDLETLETRATWTLPPCAVDVTSDRAGIRRWILTGGGAPFLGRIALDGAVTATVSLPASLGGSAVVARRVHYDETTHTVTVMSSSPMDAPELMRQSFLDVFEAESLAVRFSLALRGRNEELWVPGPGELGVYQTSTAPTAIDLGTGEVTVLSALPTDCPSVQENAVLSVAANTLAVAGRMTLVLQTLDAPRCDEFAFWERERLPSALAAWPGDPRLMLVGLVREERERPDSEATLAFFDLADRRFLWPSQAVGDGDLSLIRAHPSGALYAVGEQFGWVIRIRAAR